MWRRTLWIILTPLACAGLLVLATDRQARGVPDEVTVLRVGYFASVLHAPVLVALSDGTLARELGNVTIEERLFGAGPALIEALFAGEIDVAYVGPNPAVNAWVRSQGRALRIVAAVTRGGEGFVVRDGWQPAGPIDYAGKVLASPQTGNTQDISLRRFLHDRGVGVGGSDGVRVIAPGNPELFAMFVRGDIHGAWVAEPWLTRLLTEAGGHLLVADHDAYTAYIAVRPALLEKAPELVTAWLRGHIKTVQRLNADRDGAATAVAAELSRLWQQPVDEAAVRRSLDNLQFVWGASLDGLMSRAYDAYVLGFLGSEPPVLEGLVDPAPLAEALSSVDHIERMGERTAL